MKMLSDRDYDAHKGVTWDIFFNEGDDPVEVLLKSYIDNGMSEAEAATHVLGLKSSVAMPEELRKRMSVIAGGVHKKMTTISPGGRPADDSSMNVSPKKNWVERAGGLPRYIRMVAHAMMRKGHPKSMAIGMAVGIVRNWAEGKGDVSPKVRAAAAKAIAEWEAKRAKAHVTKSEDVGWNIDDWDDIAKAIESDKLLRLDPKVWPAATALIIKRWPPVDGDHDGFVYDGTPRQMKAPPMTYGLTVRLTDGKKRLMPFDHLKRSVAPALAAAAFDNGGFTYSTRGKGRLYDVGGKHSGWVVGISGHSFIRKATTKEDAASQIREFFDQNQNDRPSDIIGGWFDEEHGEICIDYVVIFEQDNLYGDRGAESFARRQNQQGIFSLETGEYLDTGGSGDVRAF